MALMVKSRLEAASRGVIEGSNVGAKISMAGPVLLSRRGTLKSQVSSPELVNFTTPKLLPTRSTRPRLARNAANWS